MIDPDPAPPPQRRRQRDGQGVVSKDFLARVAHYYRIEVRDSFYRSPVEAETQRPEVAHGRVLH